MATPAQDRLALIISSLTLFVSIATPLVTYKLLDPKIKELNDKQFISDVQDFSSVWASKSKSPVPAEFRFVIRLKVRIRNVGALPLNCLRIAFQPPLPAGTTVEFKPPLQFAPPEEKTGPLSGISFKQPLGPGQSVEGWLAAPVPSGFREVPPFAKDAYLSDECAGFETDTCEAPPMVWVSSEVHMQQSSYLPAPVRK